MYNRKIDPNNKEKVMGVYFAQDNRTNQILYVGHSRNVNYRVKVHIRQLKYSYLEKNNWEDYYKTDPENKIEWILLEEVEENKLNLKEYFWKEKLKPKFNIATVSKKSFKTGKNDNIPSKEEILENLEKYSGPKNYADSINVSRRTIYNWLDKYNIAYIAPRIANSDKLFAIENIDPKLVEKMIKENISMVKIAKYFNVNRSAMQFFCNANKILYGKDKKLEDTKIIQTKINSIDLDKEYELLTIKEISEKYSLPVKSVSEAVRNIDNFEDKKKEKIKQSSSRIGKKRANGKRDNCGRFIK